MSKTMITATLALAFISTARAAEVPKQYRGLWCEGGQGYYRCKQATSESYLNIRRDRINLSEESDCRITAVTPRAEGHRLRVRCPSDAMADSPKQINLRIDGRGRLYLD
jgi:hypothetical protein